MPRSFLVKKSESPPSPLSRNSQEKSPPKLCNSSGDSESVCRDQKPGFLRESPETPKWEPLDTSEYERCIERAHTLARQRHLPWLRPQGDLAAPSTPLFPRRRPPLLMDYPSFCADIGFVAPDRAFPLLAVESRAHVLPEVKAMPHWKFQSENSAFERFVRHPNGREVNVFHSGAEPERKPDINLLSLDVTASRRVPSFVRNPAPYSVLKRKSYCATKTAAEPAPKKIRTRDDESSPGDSDPSEADSEPHEADSAHAKHTEENGRSEKPHKCNHCVMTFTRPSDLQRHLLIHNNNKPYKCEECDREFTWFGNFQKHILSHVNAGSSTAGSRAFSAMFTLAQDQVKDLFIKEGDKYRCRLCSKDFTRLSGLKTHIRMHTGERPFVCQVCSFAFTTSRALKMHMRLHTGEKPYKCEVCERAFTRRDEMHTHMYIHKGEKPFKCDKCSASFIRYGHLQRHLLIHSDDKPYKCKRCPKSFTQYRNLQTHMYKHTGERPYRCKFCPKGFTQYGTLQAHERTHTGEKPFKCQMCEKAFITSSHLRWHIKTQHGQE